jgi:hypothetical protein
MAGKCANINVFLPFHALSFGTLVQKILCNRREQSQRRRPRPVVSVTSCSSKLQHREFCVDVVRRRGYSASLRYRIRPPPSPNGMTVVHPVDRGHEHVVRQVLAEPPDASLIDLVPEPIVTYRSGGATRTHRDAGETLHPASRRVYNPAYWTGTAHW